MKMTRARVALMALLMLVAAPCMAQEVHDNGVHSAITGAPVTTAAVVGSPFTFLTLDIGDATQCTASTNVLTNTATAGANWTMQIQGSADGVTFYPIDLDTAATATTSLITLASGSGVAAAASFTTGFRYVRVLGWWGTAPSGGGASTCRATLSCKR